MEAIINDNTPGRLIHHNMSQNIIRNNIRDLQPRHDAAWEGMRGGDNHHGKKKTHHGKKGAAGHKGKSHYKHGHKKPVRHRGAPRKGAHKGAGTHKGKGKDGHHHNNKARGGVGGGGHGGKKNGGYIGHRTDGGGSKHGKQGHHAKEGKDGKHPSHGDVNGKHPVGGKMPAKSKDKHPVGGEKPANGKHPAKGKRPKDHDKDDGGDEKAKDGEGGMKDGEEKKRGGEGKENAKGAKKGDEKKGDNKGTEKGVAGGKGKESKTKKEPQDSKGSTPALPGTKAGPPAPVDKATAPLTDTKPVQNNGDNQAAIPGSPFFTKAGPNIPGSPNHPPNGRDPGSSKSIATPSVGHNDSNNNKTSGTRILTYTLVPLTIIAGAVYGVVAYRRKNTRRRALRRCLQEDAEAAAVMATRSNGGNDDDASSLMSAVSYRPPAPFASEVDVTTETMENNSEIVVGNSSQHLISAPKRDEGRSGDYQDYSHVCQSQMLGKKCTNHSISCFAVLNHSNGGLNALAALRTPSALTSRVLIPMIEQSAATSAIANVSEKQLGDFFSLRFFAFALRSSPSDSHCSNL
ncbi:hypothetical protein BGW39_004131 [Mortierella sp. 14UC]|nr:hypothetical protein BGW39_004131 [Mortierella sp. 14UC]